VRRLPVMVAAGFSAAACAASAAGPAPTPQLFSSPLPPVAGRQFSGLAVILPAEAQVQWQSFRATCVAWAAGRRMIAVKTAVPRGSPVPDAVVCSWKVPVGTAGKQFRARIATDVVWNDDSLEHDPGQLVKWTIQRR